MKHYYNLFGFIVLILLLSSCGLNENKRKKEFAEKLFQSYPTQQGDTPYKADIVIRRQGEGVPALHDTVLIVKNGAQYFEINKYGVRKEVQFFKVKR